MPPQPQVPTALVVGHAPGFAAVGLAAAAQLTGAGVFAGWLLGSFNAAEFVSLGWSQATSLLAVQAALAATSTLLSGAGCWLELGRQTGQRQFSGAALLNLFGLSLGSLELGAAAAVALALKLLGKLG